MRKGSLQLKLGDGTPNVCQTPYVKGGFQSKSRTTACNKCTSPTQVAATHQQAFAVSKANELQNTALRHLQLIKRGKFSTFDHISETVYGFVVRAPHAMATTVVTASIEAAASKPSRLEALLALMATPPRGSVPASADVFRGSPCTNAIRDEEEAGQCHVSSLTARVGRARSSEPQDDVVTPAATTAASTPELRSLDERALPQAMHSGGQAADARRAEHPVQPSQREPQPGVGTSIPVHAEAAAPQGGRQRQVENSQPVQSQPPSRDQVCSSRPSSAGSQGCSHQRTMQRPGSGSEAGYALRAPLPKGERQRLELKAIAATKRAQVRTGHHDPVL